MEKVVACDSFVLAPNASGLFQLWNHAISRQDKKLQPSSKVCSLHFEEADIIKRKHVVCDGQALFYPLKNWSLKKNAWPRRFSDCPAHFNKPRSKKRNQPAERQVYKKRKGSKHNQDGPPDDADDVADHWEPAPVLNEGQPCDPWVFFSPRKCKIPPAWYWVTPTDDPTVSICMQLHIKTKAKSLQFRDKTVYFGLNCKVFGRTHLNSFHENETLVQQFERVIRDFDEAQTCPGETEEQFRKIKFYAGAFLQEKVWRSADCKSVYNGTGQQCCPDCYTIKRALGRLISKSLPTMSDEDKLQKLENNYRLAMKKLDQKSEKIQEMEKEIALMEAQEHIYRLEKSILTSELKIKQGIIDFRASEMLKLRQEFAQKASGVQQNDKTLIATLNGLNSLVFE